MKKSLIPLLASLLLASCGGNSSPDKATSPAPAASPTASATATATEIFHLRSECAQLGEKILEGKLVGVALTQDQVSHYDPKTNRCYVELTVQSADLSKPEYLANYLYDGQTGEMLASALTKNNKRTGIVFGVAPPGGFDEADAYWNQAEEFISEKMEDDRKN